MSRGSLIEDGAGPEREQLHKGPGHWALHGATLYAGINSTGWTPPDDNLAVGPTETIVAVNEQLAFFDQNNNGAPLYGGANLGFTSLFRNPVGGSVDQYSTTDPALCKVVQLSWTCSRKVLGKKSTTESVQSAKVVIRK